ncbi:MAG: DUF4494 domain-containing protein [Bacteroidota bacterium]|nr:DUF4494 domain-containing protein [Bacteroidota bacterium]
MHNWFTCKVKYVKIDESGREKKVTEPYLIDAVSFSEAETLIHKILEPYIKGDMEIKSLSRANIADVFDFDDDGMWFKTKLVYHDLDPDTEKKTKVTKFIFVKASNVKEAYERVEENLNLLIPYDMPSIQETPIVDVFPYEIDEEKALDGRNVRPLEETDVIDSVTGKIVDDSFSNEKQMEETVTEEYSEKEEIGSSEEEYNNPEEQEILTEEREIDENTSY